MEDQYNQNPIPLPTPPSGQTSVKSNNFLIVIILALALIFISAVGFLVLQAKFIVQSPPSSPISQVRSNTERCVEKGSLNCADETELSFECSSDYQDWAQENCPGWSQQEGQFCGGIAGVDCPEGYSCEYDGNYPDAGGVCAKLTEQILPISGPELDAGWYPTNSQDEKKTNTPENWIYTVATEPGVSSCWHVPSVRCGYMLD